MSNSSPQNTITSRAVKAAPRVGIVSLGCPKALVDSERILTRLRSEGYEISGSYDDARARAPNISRVDASLDVLCFLHECFD